MSTTRSIFFFFLNDPAPPETSPLPLHDPLPIPPPPPVLHALVEIDPPRRGQCRYALAQQPIEQVRMSGAEVRKAMIVHTHSAAQPPIGVMALAQASECPRAADSFAGRMKPQRQQQSRAHRRLTRRVSARPHGFLQRPQVEPLDIIPNRPRRMRRSNQT